MKSRLLLIALMVFACSSCSDDENPAAADSPCLDENTRCASFRLVASAMTSEEFYMDLDPLRYTTFSGTWPNDAKVISGYGPGRQMIVSVRFATPLVARYDVERVLVGIAAGVMTTCTNGFVQSTPEIVVEGDWTITENRADFERNCSDGSSRLSFTARSGSLKAGDELRGITWTVTVPETYTSGSANGSAILPGDLEVIGIGWSVEVDGDARGNPPVWPGEFPER